MRGQVNTYPFTHIAMDIKYRSLSFALGQTA